MKLGSLRALAVAAAAVALAAPTRVAAQRGIAHEKGLLTMMQREVEKSTELLEQFWDSAFGREEDKQDESPVVVLMVEEETQDVLSDEEKAFACRVAVQRVDEQAALTREAQRMTSRLRTPMGGLVTFHFDGQMNCEDLETAALVQECKRVVAMAPKIEQFLREGKTHEAICDVVKMTAELLENDELMPVVVQDPPLSCKLCKRFVKMVADAVKQDMAQVQQVREILGDICDSMSTDSMCHTFIKRYDDVVQWLVHGTDPEVVCERLTMCTAPVETTTSDDAAAVLAVAPADGDHACFYCQHITGAVAFVIQHAPDQLETLHTVIKYVCKLSPKDCKCDELSKNFGKIVDWTKQGKTPDQICTALGMCKKTQGRNTSAKMLGLVMNPKFSETIASLAMQQQRDDKKCFYCEYFTTLLQIAIQEDEKDMDQIRQYADLICGILGDNKYCHDYVSKLDTAIDDIKKGEKPHAICTDMQFCAKTQAEAEEAVTLSLASGDAKQCLYCDFLVTLLEVVLQQDDADVEQIRQYADLVCGMLGDGSVCHHYVDKFDAAVDAIKQGKKPHEICAQFKYCTKSQQLALPPPSPIKYGDQNCFYCDYFVTILEIVIQEDKADIDQVREFADMICGMLGGDNICHQYINKFDAAVDGLKKGKKPREICVDLKFCTKQAKAIIESARMTDEKKCLYCDFVVTILQVVIIQDDSDISMVRQYADLICGMLGDSNVCHQYVDKFDVIVDELKAGKTSHQICADIKLCTKAQALALPAPLVSKHDDKTCFYCDYVMTILEVALQEDANDVDSVRLYAEIACGMLGDGNVCHQYMDKFNKAIAALKKGTKPREICAEFKYCTAKQLGLNAPGVLNTHVLLKDVMVKTAVTPAVGKIDDCFFCMQVASLMKVAIAQDPSKVAEIRTVADLVCKVLPAGNKCHDVMRKMDQIIDSIKKGEEPAGICRDMQLCKKAAVDGFLSKLQVAGVKDNTCAYCEGIATVLEYAVKSKPEQVQQLREAAGIVCDFMPKDDKCHDDLKMFDKAVASMKSGKSPHNVCVDANLCRDKMASSDNVKLMPSSIAKFNMLDAETLSAKAAAEKSMSMGCLLCEYTAETLVWIKGDASELRLAKEALETMCFVLPPHARCDVLSSKFDNLAELVGQGKSPSQACHAISLCDKAFVEPASSNRIDDIVAEQ